MTLIVPEAIHLDSPRYAPGHWDYPRRCADIALAMEATRERIEEWDRDADPHGWWHERPLLIALYNEVLRLRAETRANERQRISDAINTEAARLGYDVTEVYDVAWPHLADFVANLLGGSDG